MDSPCEVDYLLGRPLVVGIMVGAIAGALLWIISVMFDVRFGTEGRRSVVARGTAALVFVGYRYLVARRRTSVSPDDEHEGEK